MTSMVPQTLIELPRRWDVLAGLMNERGYKQFVEVGCKEGRTTGFILDSVSESFVTAIDPWIAMPDQKDVVGGETYEDWDFAKIEEEFWGHVGLHKQRCKMLRMTSEDAIKQVETADLVFIDAAHDYENVKADIKR